MDNASKSYWDNWHDNQWRDYIPFDAECKARADAERKPATYASVLMLSFVYEAIAYSCNNHLGEAGKRLINYELEAAGYSNE